MELDTLKSLKKPIAGISIAFSIFGILSVLFAALVLFGILDSLESTLNSQLQPLLSSLDGAVELSGSVEDELDNSNSTLSSLKSSLGSLENGISSTGSTVKGFGNTLKSAGGLLSSLSSYGDSLSSAGSDLESSADGLASTAISLQNHSKSISDAKSSVSKIKSSLSKQKSSLLKLKTELPGLFGNIKLALGLVLFSFVLMFGVLILVSANTLL